MSDHRPELFNPTTGEPIEPPARTATDELQAVLDAGREAAAEWKAAGPTVRCGHLGTLADLLERDADEAAANITREMGKPIAQARGEIAKCIELLRAYAEQGPSLVATRTVETEARRSEVRVEPLGLILGIMPWNFPYWQVVRWAVPTLTAGNTCLLKHADNVPAAAAHVARLAVEAGLPTGVFASVSVANGDMRSVIEDDRVRGVSLTGSGRAGRAVASQAGAALKPTVLELGGSDAAIILPDADLDRHLHSLVMARFQNTGQTCIAAKRYVVHADIADEFRDRLVEAVLDLAVGDPADEATQIGPMARLDLRDGLHEQVEQTIVEGGRLIAGGQPIERPGFFYEPTVIDQVQPGMTPFTEELFGPAASIVEARDDAEMLSLANAVPYGLSATVWTEDLDRAERFADGLDVGCVFVNQLAKSDWRLPFGGVKESGYGRELGGYGVAEFANLKAVWVA